METLTAPQIQEFCQSHPGWSLSDGKLESRWTFSDFVAAMAFVNRVAVLAEQAGHHPDIDIRYNRVTLGLVTHDANGITGRDTALARQISEMFTEI